MHLATFLCYVSCVGCEQCISQTTKKLLAKKVRLQGDIKDVPCLHEFFLIYGDYIYIF